MATCETGCTTTTLLPPATNPTAYNISWPAIITVLSGISYSIAALTIPGVSAGWRAFVVIFTILWTIIWTFIFTVYRGPEYSGLMWLLLIPVIGIMLVFLVALIIESS